MHQDGPGATAVKRLYVTLSDRAPVSIDPREWPCVAKVEDSDDRAHDFQANRRWKMFVRQHADGRAIVYGVYTSAYQGENDVRGGHLLEGDGPLGADGILSQDIAAAVYALAEELGFPRSLAAECVGDLPAEDI